MQLEDFPIDERYIRRVKDKMRLYIVKTPVILVSSGEDPWERWKI